MERPNPISITARFAAAAAGYDREAAIQRRVAEEVVRLLDGLETPTPILEVGCGTGLMTALLRDRFPQSELHAVDLCGPMIEQAKAKLEHGRRIQWHVGDARRWGTPQSFQLVTGSSVLHWLSPIGRSLRHLATLIRQGGQIALGAMVQGTLAELHEARQIVAPHKTGRDLLPSAESVLASLAATSLEVQQSRVVTLSNTHADAEEFLRAIHAQGVTTGVYDTARLLNRSEMAALIQTYDQRYRAANGGVCATYQVLLARARKQTREGIS